MGTGSVTTNYHGLPDSSALATDQHPAYFHQTRAYSAIEIIPGL